MIKINYPRIKTVCRSVPHEVTIGDRAVVLANDGLLALLTLLTHFTPSLNNGFWPQFNIPGGLAMTGVDAILEPSQKKGVRWINREAQYRLFTTTDSPQEFEAEVCLTEYSAHTALFQVEGRSTTGQPLLTGTLRFEVIAEPKSHSGKYRAALRKALIERQRRKLAGYAYFKSIWAPTTLLLNTSQIIEVELENPGDVATKLAISIRLPFGAGLSLDTTPPLSLELQPHEVESFSFMVRADRPHEVNLGRLWKMEIQVQGPDSLEKMDVSIAVPDPEPGRVFYVLTEDCETFDGGPKTGDYHENSRLGNNNNFMDPDDYRVQMIEKPNRLNTIAEKYGAHWTHFWVASHRFAAAWASTKSETGEWPKIVTALDESIRQGARYHEYAPHIHFDYEPESKTQPQPRLIYDPTTDGIIPNDYYHPITNPTHRYHDWDGAARGHIYLKQLGNWNELDSKMGSLRKTARYLARQQANQRYALGARTGSFDFGESLEDQQISTQAFWGNGLRGDSDDYRPGAPVPPGGQLFWCKETNRRIPIENLQEARMLQLCVTMDTRFDSADSLNDWFAQGWAACQGPGRHVLMSMTHAMFMEGQPDSFRSLEGGSFENLDKHLAWVCKNHPMICFATFSEALLEFLDYYTPTLEAYVVPHLCGGNLATGLYKFPIRLLGIGIRVSPGQPAQITIAAPPLFDSQGIMQLRVRTDDQILESKEIFLPEEQPRLTITLTDRQKPLFLEVQLSQVANSEVAECFRQSGEKLFYEPSETPKPDLFQCRTPVVIAPGHYIFWPDIGRLLMNPIAGHDEPVGRRIHPLGGIAFGISLAAASHASMGCSLNTIRINWFSIPDLDTQLLAECIQSSDADPNMYIITVTDPTGRVISIAEVTTTLTSQPD